MAVVRDRDRKAARQLPDRFVKLSGLEANARISELVSWHWMSYKAVPRVELVHELLPVLEPLLKSGAAVSYRERALCEGIIASWLTRQP
jgi:hypothetical protein